MTILLAFSINFLFDNDGVFGINKAFKTKGACLVEVFVDKDQLFEPRLSSKKLEDGQIVSMPLEDMAPFLDREDFLSNMIIKPWKNKDS